MSSEFKVPDGRDFDSVFARGKAGVDTGYYTVTGDDLGSYYAGGGSGIKTGIVTADGTDLGDIFRLKGDADLQLCYIMDRIWGWGRYILDFQKNTYELSPVWGDTDYGQTHIPISESISQDNILHVYQRLLDGCRIELSVRWGLAGLYYTDGSGFTSPYGFAVEQYPTIEDPRFIWRMRCKKGYSAYQNYYLSFAVFANIYLN